MGIGTAKLAFAGVALVLSVGACTKAGGPSSPDCTALASGSSWVPNIASASSSNHDATISETESTIETQGTLVGLSQGFGSQQEVEVDFTIGSSLGNGGSVTLTGNVTSFPPTLRGSAYPALVSLVDPNGKDWINLPRTGASGDCWQRGIFSCNGACVANAGCAPQWPSAFLTRSQWEQHQVLGPQSGSAVFPSVNTFPSCNWGNQGTTSPPTDPDNPPCAFSNTTSGDFLDGAGTLPVGSYRARYVLLASSYSNLPSGYDAGLDIRVIQKSHPTLAGGAVDLNVVLVGNATVNASRTPKGQQNLDSLFTKVASLFGAAGGGGAAAIKLGTVQAVEWSCQQGGEGYSQLGTSQLPEMFAAAAPLLPADEEGKAISIFLVSSIVNEIASLAAGSVIDGYSGAIGGPPIYGTSASGLVMATFDRLDNYNPACPTGASTCDDTQVEPAFWNSETTITHEMGHYLGLNHPSESGGTAHDPIYDTPICTATLPIGSASVITQGSCLGLDANVYPIATNYGLPGDPRAKTCNQACPGYDSVNGTFCPQAVECPFNHVMWYTSKNFQEGTGVGDGNLFSADSTTVLDFSPLVR